MIAWAVQNIININNDGARVLNDETLSEEEKMERIKGAYGYDYQLINLITLLKPVRAEAQEQYPELKSFFAWFDDRWKHLEENKFIKGPCKCIGCDPEKKVANDKK